MGFHSDLEDGYSFWPSPQTPEEVTGSANVTSQMLVLVRLLVFFQ